MAPRFRVHGTVVAGELHRFEAVLIIIPANGDPMVQHPPSLADEARGLLKDWGLTRRESEVALLVAQGWSSPRIAVEMHVTVHTVRRHTEAVFRKLQVHNRAELRPGWWERYPGAGTCDNPFLRRDPASRGTSFTTATV